MFDLAWSEIMLIGAVALLVIGPKELPGAIRAVSQFVRKAREMAWEMRGHVDEMVREANLDEVRSQINEIRNFDVKGEVAKAVDPDGSLRRTVEDAGKSMQDAARDVETSARAAAADDRPSTARDGEAPAAGDAPQADTPAADTPPADDIAEEVRNMTRETAAVALPAAEPPAFLPPEPAPVPVVPDEPPAFVPPGTPRS